MPKIDIQLKPVFKTDKWPILIAGPCSAETEAQVISTARSLSGQNIDLFRSGLWKPRTRPNSFEGVGEKGFPWLKKVQEEFGMKVTTEVANAHHVELCLEAGIDVLWIGARTTVNPFSIQEIAKALMGVDIPVMVKNPLSPDLALWLGAIERINHAGIDQIAAIHRGFSALDNSTYRNKPQWEIPLELRRHIPGIQIIIDPSHICGNRTNLQHIAQQALDLNYDGIMLESHIDPDNAWSDSKQQVDPATFSKIIDGLILRNSTTKDNIFHEQLSEFRENIDRIDKDLIHLLNDRMRVSEKIAQLKKENNVTIFQAERWNKVMESALKEARIVGLSSNFINNVLRAIHEESIFHQDNIMNMDEGDIEE